MKFDDPYDLRKDSSRFSPKALEAKFAVVDFLKELAARKDATPARTLWLGCSRASPYSVPIPGGTKMEHLDDNFADLELTASNLRENDEAFARLEIKDALLSGGLDSMKAMIGQP